MDNNKNNTWEITQNSLLKQHSAGICEIKAYDIESFFEGLARCADNSAYTEIYVKIKGNPQPVKITDTLQTGVILKNELMQFAYRNKIMYMPVLAVNNAPGNIPQNEPQNLLPNVPSNFAPKSKRRFKSFAAALVVIVIIAGISIMIFSKGGNQNNSTGKLLFQAETAASGQEQTINYEDKVTIKIPSGLFENGQKVSIYEVKNAPPLAKNMSAAALYDIKIGDAAGDKTADKTTFSQPITLEFSYDPGSIDKDLPVSQQINMCYFDEKEKLWVSTPFTVDEARNVISVQTLHLTKWAAYYTLLGYSIYPSKNFVIIYDKNYAKSTENNYKSTLGLPASGTTPQLISDISYFMEQARQSYVSAGFKLPDNSSGQNKINVFIGVLANSHRSGLSGILNIDTGSVFTSDSLQYRTDVLRFECAHELFHEVQYNEYGETGMLAYAYTYPWWIEASADYAADNIAWTNAATPAGQALQATGLMGKDINEKFLSFPMDTFNAQASTEASNHEYAASHFIDFYLKSNAGLTFKGLLDSSKINSDVYNAFAKYSSNSGTDKTFATLYEDFALYYLFDTSSPFPNDKDLYENASDEKTYFEFKKDADGNVKEKTLSYTDILKTKDHYTSSVLAIKSNGPCKISLSLSDDAILDIAVMSDSRSAGLKGPIKKLDMNSKDFSLDITENERIFVVLCGNTRGQSVRLNVSAQYSGQDDQSNSTSSAASGSLSAKLPDLALTKEQLGITGQMGNFYHKNDGENPGTWTKTSDGDTFIQSAAYMFYNKDSKGELHISFDAIVHKVKDKSAISGYDNAIKQYPNSYKKNILGYPDLYLQHRTDTLDPPYTQNIYLRDYEGIINNWYLRFTYNIYVESGYIGKGSFQYTDADALFMKWLEKLKPLLK